jgi:DNA recombination protein RmuC
MPVLVIIGFVVAAFLIAGVTWIVARARPSAGAGDPFARISQELERLERALRADLGTARSDQSEQAKSLRDEVGGTLRGVAGLLEQRLEILRTTVDGHLTKLQDDSAAKLEAMRQTVDEKLQGTLEKRLGEAFGQVSERLEQVHRGLGEMQTLASGVGDLKRVLTNVKTRGTWGEVQLGNLLEQMFSPDQFEHNFAPRLDSAERVEYAVRYPGDTDQPVWLPIDAKFPQEDYERLVDAEQALDREAIESASRALERRVQSFAKDVSGKYIQPPRTTSFAILFLPTEGLYAELVRRPGFADALLREHNVMLCGPMTLNAVLIGLLAGYRTLAIQKRTGEIQTLLAVVKTEFGKFGDALDRVRKKIDEAGNSIDQVAVRKRAIERKLKYVEALPGTQTNLSLDLAAEDEAAAADGE